MSTQLCEKKWKWTLHRQECGGGGNCLFLAVERGIQDMFKRKVNLRQVIADTLHINNWQKFIELEDQQPHLKLQTQLHELQVNIKQVGQYYQGTDETLKWLSQNAWPELGYVILSSHGPDYTCIINPKAIVFVLLYNLDSAHWQLLYLTYNNQKMCSMDHQFLQHFLSVYK